MTTTPPPDAAALAQLDGADAAAWTGPEGPPAAEDSAGSAAAVFIQHGEYALYLTPDGGRHLCYRPDGAAEDTHIPDIPAAAVPLVDNFLTYGLPPAILAMLDGKLSPGKLLSMARQAHAVWNEAGSPGMNGEAPDDGG